MLARHRRPILATAALWGCMVLLMATVQAGTAASSGEDRPFWGEVAGASVILWPWLIGGPLAFHLGRRLPVRGPLSKRRLLQHVGIWVAMCLAYPLLMALPAPLLGVPFSFAAAYGQWMVASLFWNGLLYAMLHVAGSLWELRLESEALSVRAARAEAQLARARVAALQAQLHPHFLFNTLNSITALIRTDDRDRAIRMVVRLSDLLRRVLSASRTPTLPLAEELEMLEDYLELEHERHQDRLSVEYDIADDTRDVAVPTLLLQPLAENAIKHGIAPSQEGGRVVIVTKRSGDRLLITLTNTGELWDPGKLVEGIGLSNTRARLLETYGDAARLELSSDDGATRVALTLPLAADGDS